MARLDPDKFLMKSKSILQVLLPTLLVDALYAETETKLNEPGPMLRSVLVIIEQSGLCRGRIKPL